jgi:hypothetical protein
MSFKPSDSYSKEFVTSSPTTGAATNADATPVATADLDGSGTGTMALTVTNLDTGRYKVTGTIPAGRVRGDVLNVSVAATVGGVAGKAIVDTQVLDSKRVGDLNDPGGVAQTGDAFARIGAAGAGLTALGDARLAHLDADVSSRSTYAGGAVASVTAPVTVGTVSDKTGYSLAAAGLDAVMVEAGVNARQALSPILAAAAGVLSGAGSGTIIIKGGNVATTRITASTDASGNRSSVTLNLPI